MRRPRLRGDPWRRGVCPLLRSNRNADEEPTSAFVRAAGRHAPRHRGLVARPEALAIRRGAFALAASWASYARRTSHLNVSDALICSCSATASSIARSRSLSLTTRFSVRVRCSGSGAGRRRRDSMCDAYRRVCAPANRGARARERPPYSRASSTRRADPDPGPTPTTCVSARASSMLRAVGEAQLRTSAGASRRRTYVSRQARDRVVGTRFGPAEMAPAVGGPPPRERECSAPCPRGLAGQPHRGCRCLRPPHRRDLKLPSCLG